MEIKDFLKLTYSKNSYGYLNIRPRFYCKDGYNISIQACSMKYCSPRENIKSGDYCSVELGFPSVEDILINTYAEEVENPTETVYGYVPIEIVDELIKKHGGIDFEKMYTNATERLSELLNVK